MNILVAYPYLKPPVYKDLLRNHGTYRLIIDSGAFTAWNLKKQIRLDEYCRFLDKIELLQPFKAVQLDVFGDPEATYKNFLIMQKRGFDVMPVFTRGDTVERLEEFYAHTDYIMFGGIVVGGKNKNYVKWFLDQNKGRKAHWLGFVNMPFIKKYRPESVDSSSWKSAGIYGAMDLYTGLGNCKRFRRSDFTAPTKELVRLMQQNGFGQDQILMLREKESWVATLNDRLTFTKPEKGLAWFIGAVAHVLRAAEVEEKLGTKIYLAASTDVQTKTLFKARDHIRRIQNDKQGISRAIRRTGFSDVRSLGSEQV